MDASNRRACSPNTRMELLRDIEDWTVDPYGDLKVLWLHGVAGSGKSTISTTVANYSRQSGYLGAFLFFDRDVAERTNPSTVIRTLAHQLGLFHPGLGAAICAAIKSTPTIPSSPIDFQFQRLIVDPLLSVLMLTTNPPILVILDGLDKCGTAKDRCDLLTVLKYGSRNLPSGIKILVTSQDDFEICRAFDHEHQILAKELDITSRVNASDILTYVCHSLALICTANQYLGLVSDWLGECRTLFLTQCACGLFVWASTACAFIEEGHDPEEWLNIVLQAEEASESESALDTLYLAALQSAGRWEDRSFRSDFFSIFGAIIAAKSPFTHSAIDWLLCPCRPSLHIISRFGCVLCWTSNDSLDITIPEDVTYAGASWIHHVCSTTEDTGPVVMRMDVFLHRHLLHWLEVMSLLKISREAGSLLNSLHEWIQHYVPSQHGLLAFIDDAQIFTQTFINSIEDHPILIYLTALLFTPVTSKLYRTFHDHTTIPRIAGGFEQSWSLLRFVLRHKTPALSVAFSTDGSQIISSSQGIRMWNATSGAEVTPPFSALLRDNSIFSICFSPDGLLIASGGMDNKVQVWDTVSGLEILTALEGHEDCVLSTICVWDAMTGMALFSRIQGHDGDVTSVAFSPDGTQTVSTSLDKTVRFWDPNTGENVAPFQREHADQVLSVAYSPDGAWVASCSKVICVWDTMTGVQIIPPLDGHKGYIMSIAFSPNGKHLASGSFDKTVRVWDILIGAEILPPFHHNAGIREVAYSPDGTRVTSASLDHTVRVWDTTKPLDAVPMQPGHKDHISALTFSEDEAYVATGSWDQTVRLWNAASGTEVAPPFSGHTGLIAVLAFSSDGAWLASGASEIYVRESLSRIEVLLIRDMHRFGVASSVFSRDGSRIAAGSLDIRVWDSESGTQVVQPFRGHNDWVGALTFSPDGTHIVSASVDGSVRVLWNMISGTEAFHPMTGLRGWITLVAFCPGGDRIIAMSENNEICSWNAASGFLDWILGIEDIALKLPHLIPAHMLTRKVVLKSSIAFGTDGGQLIIMHFPTDTLTRPLIVNITQAIISLETRHHSGESRRQADLIEHRFEQYIQYQNNFLGYIQKAVENTGPIILHR
ncbi:hypothetical protein PILCRDRAFT_2026 [Piloderma croceum F 1598]|uniref:Nephrocystin 3-like N-terminal domain-containing protein n=1 Tax=Piloderma croceum (strain F 1598) TaxID=765440 RepID=A0A0C3GGF2_PILCF|nr:hypothetical protein PILCRDRAFT_2026 [Piloderma croceum F 1598]